MKDAGGKLLPASISGSGAAPGWALFWDGSRWVAAPVVYDSTAAAGAPRLSPFWYVTDETC